MATIFDHLGFLILPRQQLSLILTLLREPFWILWWRLWYWWRFYEDDSDTSDNGTWRQDRWRPRSVSWETKGRQREVDLVEEMVRRGFISGWRSRRVLWKMSEQDNVKSLRWIKTTLLYLCYNLSATPWPEATDRRWRSIEKSGELSQGSSWKRHSWGTSWRWWSMDKYEELSQSSSRKRQQFLLWSW